MTIGVVAVIVIFLLLTGGIAVAAMRRSSGAVAPPVSSIEDDDVVARHARQEAAAERGTELLERRIELDARRGTLGGDTQLYDALESLQNDLRSGQISEEAYEAEKIRLLGG